jgi:kinesin family protein 5
MVDYIFSSISNTPDHIEFIIKVSIVEIYMEKIKDLFDITKTDLKIREDKARGVKKNLIIKFYRCIFKM